MTCSYSGSLTVSGVPQGFSTLAGDYTLDLSRAVGSASCYNDYYRTGGNNWEIFLTPSDGISGDGFHADIVVESLDQADGIPSDTYTVSAAEVHMGIVSGAVNPGEYLKGYMTDNGLGGTIFTGGYDEMGYVSEYAPAIEGDLKITNHGDGSYTIEFDFADDIGNRWDGVWTGEIADAAPYHVSAPGKAAALRLTKRQAGRNLFQPACCHCKQRTLLSRFARTSFSAFPFGLVTVFARRTRTPFRLHIAFRLIYQCLARKTHLIGLSIDLKKLYLDFVTETEDIFHFFGLAPVYFGYMEQTFLAREYLDEGAEIKYGLHCAFVHFAYFRNSHDTFDPFERSIHRLFVVAEDIHYAFGDSGLFGFLGNGYHRSGLFLYLLYHFAAFAYDSADEFARNAYLYDTRHMRFVFSPRFADALEHFAHYVHPTPACLLESPLKHIV